MNKGASPPAVSQHLKVLKNAGPVLDRRAGNRRIYRKDTGQVPESEKAVARERWVDFKGRPL